MGGGEGCYGTHNIPFLMGTTYNFIYCSLVIDKFNILQESCKKSYKEMHRSSFCLQDSLNHLARFESSHLQG